MLLSRLQRCYRDFVVDTGAAPVPSLCRGGRRHELVLYPIGARVRLRRAAHAISRRCAVGPRAPNGGAATAFRIGAPHGAAISRGDADCNVWTWECLGGG